MAPMGGRRRESAEAGENRARRVEMQRTERTENEKFFLFPIERFAGCQEEEREKKTMIRITK